MYACHVTLCNSHSNIVEREVKESIVAGNDRVQIEHLKQFFIRDITQMGHMVRTTEEEKTIDTILGTVMVQF